MNRIVPALGLAALIIAAALAVTFARSQGLIGSDMGERIVMVVIGLVLVVLNNAVPKQLASPRASARAEAFGQSVRRTTGWAMTLGGLAWAAIWVFAPMDLARTLSIVAMGGAVAVVLGHFVWALRRYRGPRRV